MKEAIPEIAFKLFVLFQNCREREGGREDRKDSYLFKMFAPRHETFQFVKTSLYSEILTSTEKSSGSRL